MRSVESEAPITAAKAKKVVRAAAAADIRSIRNEKKKMKASGASATTHISGEPYRRRAELGQVDAADPGNRLRTGRSSWPAC